MSTTGQFFYIVLVFAAVALLAFYATKAVASAKRGSVRTNKRNLHVVESIGAGMQSTIQLVKVGERYFLIGVTKERVALLAEIEGSQIELPKMPSAPFEGILKRFQSRDGNGRDRN